MRRVKEAMLRLKPAGCTYRLAKTSSPKNVLNESVAEFSPDTPRQGEPNGLVRVSGAKEAS